MSDADAKPHILLATATDAWDLDDDAQPLLAALDKAHILGTPAVWSDESVDWSAADAVVIRSTWDYATRRPEFLSWVERVAAGTTLLNSADMILWNTNKRYLGELAEHLPVVDTFYAEGDAQESLRLAISRALDSPQAQGSPTGAGEFVVKPTVSAGSRSTGRFSASDVKPASELAANIAASGREVMIQPYLPSVDTNSETGLVYFNGQFSHAFEKGAILHLHEVGSDHAEHGLFALERIGPRIPRSDQLEVAQSLIDHVSSRFSEAPLYARVDLLDSIEGAPLILELEMTEPSWFLATSPGAADTAARAIRARVAKA